MPGKPGKMYRAPLPPQLSDSNRMIIGSRGARMRVYQVWKGNNRFFLGGRLIFGPDVRSLILTVFLIVTPVTLFTVFVSHRLVNEFHHHLGNLIIALAVIFAIYDIILLLLTSGRDPGIIPRNAHPPERDDDCGSTMSAEWSGNQTSRSSLPPTKDVLVNGIVVKVKYCHTCMLYRPPRCSHCSICNNCVERFDHHCPWVGQCIGKRNYRVFFMFVSSTTLLCLYVFAFCWVNLNKIMDAYDCHLWKAILKSPVSGILIIYTFIAAWFVGGLTAFHLYLICTNQTTYENFRYRYDRRMNPYNRGCYINLIEIFCLRIPNSKNNFRAKVKRDSAAFASSLSLGRVISPDLVIGGKRHAVAEDEFDDIQSQIEGAVGLERSGTLPPRSSWGSHKSSWDIAPDLEMLAADFGMPHGFTDGEKFHGSHRYSAGSGKE